jgi:hypothetical protein
MTRHWGLSSRTAFDGGTNPQSGSHGDRYASPNIIRFPAPSLPANSELPLGAPLLIRDDICALCAMGIVVICICAAIGLLLFAGSEIFDLFDLG